MSQQTSPYSNYSQQKSASTGPFLLTTVHHQRSSRGYQTPAGTLVLQVPHEAKLHLYRKKNSSEEEGVQQVAVIEDCKASFVDQ
mmetsp:Transcript_30778/g.51163  ORF Transcript_30778/g.51163 Transcript_30778/m.51163 type:complete len:84 (+) Transcript_30778:146-397(+)